MTYSEGAALWRSLPDSEKQRFYNIAAKESSDHTAFEWFMHLVPDEIKDDPDKIAVFMDGGTVTTSDGEVHELPDRDVSRIESGANGGDYTTDNTIMEDSSVNRSRGAEDMSSSEYDTAVADNAEAVDILESGTVVGAEPAEVISAAVPEPSIFSEIGGAALEAVTPALVSLKVGMTVADKCGDTPMQKFGFGSLAGGLTTALFLNPVTGPVMYTGTLCVAGWKLGSFVARKVASA